MGFRFASPTVDDAPYRTLIPLQRAAGIYQFITTAVHAGFPQVETARECGPQTDPLLRGNHPNPGTIAKTSADPVVDLLARSRAHHNQRDSLTDP